MTFVEIVAFVRDIAFLSFLLVSAVLALILYRKLSATVKTVKRTIESATRMVSAVSAGFAEPPPKRSRVASGARGAWAILSRLVRRRS